MEQLTQIKDYIAIEEIKSKYPQIYEAIIEMKEEGFIEIRKGLVEIIDKEKIKSK